MSDTTTSYDDAQVRHLAATALRAGWSADPERGRAKWLWSQFTDAADTCARIAVADLLNDNVDSARQWAAAHRLLSDRVDRGHREHQRKVERQREAAA